MGQYIINLTVEQENILNNDLLSIQDWLQGAIDGKINNCKKRMIREWEPRMKSRYTSLPTNDNELIDKIRAEPDYEDRVTREAREAQSRATL